MYLVTEDSKSFLQTELEPVTACHPVVTNLSFSHTPVRIPTMSKLMYRQVYKQKVADSISKS